MPIRNILTIAGTGGKGGVCFTRDASNRKSVGGSGGRGGNIYLSFSNDPLKEPNLAAKYVAGSGHSGGNEGARGKNGDDIYIVSPRDYIWTRSNTLDKFSFSYQNSLNTNNLIVKGGIGGFGNGVMGKDLYKNGVLGEINEFAVDCRIVTDFILFGLPNAGKSTLMKALSGMEPKISNIPFSSEAIRFFSIRLMGKDLIGADMPGIIDVNYITKDVVDVLSCSKNVLILTDIQRLDTHQYTASLRSVIPKGPKIYTVGTKCDDITHSANTIGFDFNISCKTGLGLNKLVSNLLL
jgi:GTPase involved in cell partitioning and DNA repair